MTPPTDLLHWSSTAAGVAIACWAAWRLNESPRAGDWLIKLSTLLVFAAAVMWTFDRLTGNTWRVDFPAMMLALAAYLWSGVVRHYRANRRGDRRALRTIERRHAPWGKP